jgi:hypothetical protein
VLMNLNIIKTMFSIVFIIMKEIRVAVQKRQSTTRVTDI